MFKFYSFKLKTKCTKYYLLHAEEFNLTEDLAWTFFHFSRHQHQFYLSAQYFASDQLFLFYVIVIGGREVINIDKSEASIHHYCAIRWQRTSEPASVLQMRIAQ